MAWSRVIGVAACTGSAKAAATSKSEILCIFLEGIGWVRTGGILAQFFGAIHHADMLTPSFFDHVLQEPVGDARAVCHEVNPADGRFGANVLSAHLAVYKTITVPLKSPNAITKKLLAKSVLFSYRANHR